MALRIVYDPNAPGASENRGNGDGGRPDRGKGRKRRRNENAARCGGTDVMLANGRIQRIVFDEQTGTYAEVGRPRVAESPYVLSDGENAW